MFCQQLTITIVYPMATVVSLWLRGVPLIHWLWYMRELADSVCCVVGLHLIEKLHEFRAMHILVEAIED